jgi:NTP pyrophosphatase (non-canonical NTP hydrolase)
MKLFSLLTWAGSQAASFFALFRPYMPPQAHAIPPERLRMALDRAPPLPPEGTSILSLEERDRAHRTLVERTEEAQRRRAAVDTLTRLGYSWHGGVLWRPPLGDAPDYIKPSLTLGALRRANAARQAEWCPDQLPDLSFRGNELAGETGEACNEIKKLERERHGWRGSRTTKAKLASELADVIMCADLVALAADIDLTVAVIEKFNEGSRANGLSVFIPHYFGMDLARD